MCITLIQWTNAAKTDCISPTGTPAKAKLYRAIEVLLLRAALRSPDAPTAIALRSEHLRHMPETWGKLTLVGFHPIVASLFKLARLNLTPAYKHNTHTALKCQHCLL